MYLLIEFIIRPNFLPLLSNLSLLHITTKKFLNLKTKNAAIAIEINNCIKNDIPLVKKSKFIDIINININENPTNPKNTFSGLSAFVSISNVLLLFEVESETVILEKLAVSFVPD